MGTEPQEPSATCSTCPNWHAQQRYHVEAAVQTIAECRRGPPVYGKRLLDGNPWPWRIFPVTAMDDWCGEHPARRGR